MPCSITKCHDQFPEIDNVTRLSQENKKHIKKEMFLMKPYSLVVSDACLFCVPALVFVRTLWFIFMSSCLLRSRRESSSSIHCSATSTLTDEKTNAKLNHAHASRHSTHLSDNPHALRQPSSRIRRPTVARSCLRAHRRNASTLTSATYSGSYIRASMPKSIMLMHASFSHSPFLHEGAQAKDNYTHTCGVQL